MEAQQILVKFQMERYKIFKAQDYQNAKFDVVFDFNGKKLYAHKFMLCSVSTTFDSMLSERWSKENEPIKIEGYLFEDFKEFLTFIYSGECNLTNENIFSMVDIAEFYGVKELKNACVKFLKNTKIDASNVYQMIQLADKYSINEFKKCVVEFVSKNLTNLIKSEQFYLQEKSVVKFLLSSCQSSVKQEELFEAVYKWAEIHANENQKLITEKMSDLLPLIKFEKMKIDFFIKIIYKKHFLFSEKQIDNILLAQKQGQVKIIDKNGKNMKGKLECGDIDAVVDVIISLKNSFCDKFYGTECFYFWETRQQKPSTPFFFVVVFPKSKLINDVNVEWYLLYDHEGNLAIKHRNIIKNGSDYLLAEMYAENGFEFSVECKIEFYPFV